MGKYLDFYKKCMEDNGRLPYVNSDRRCNGLCEAIAQLPGERYGANIHLWKFEPMKGDDWSGFHGWWAGDSGSPQLGQCTPMRQNILLLMACLDDENFNDL